MTGDSTVREIFNMLVDFFSFIVLQMKRIPTGFGVDLYTFCIALIVTSVVIVGIVNVVKVNSSNNVITVKRLEREARHPHVNSSSKSNEDK